MMAKLEEEIKRKPLRTGKDWSEIYIATKRGLRRKRIHARTGKIYRRKK